MKFRTMTALAVLAVTVWGSHAAARESEERDLTKLSLEELMEIRIPEIRAGEQGSYVSRLSELLGDKRNIQVHGYLSMELSLPYRQESKEASFDLHHAVLYFKYLHDSRVTPELGLELEHSGEDFYVPFAFFDIALRQDLILRAGYFAVPVGAFNEYQYPDFLRVTAQKPVLGTEVIPALWSEAGVQLRGKVDLDGGRNVNFAVFAGNGLEQKDSDPNDGVIDEGGSLRGMRRNYRDKNNSDKGLGGRLGMKLAKGIDAGVSVYSGAYTVDGRRRLSIYDIDFTYQRAPWLLRAEAATAIQEISGGDLRKRAGYIMAAYRATPLLEPYLQLEASDLDAGPEDRQTAVLLGLVFHPSRQNNTSTTFKFDWKTVWDDDGARRGMGMAQFNIAF